MSMSKVIHAFWCAALALLCFGCKERDAISQAALKPRPESGPREIALRDEYKEMHARLGISAGPLDLYGHERLSRKTPVGDVRISVTYEKDESASHLNPAMRVTRLLFEFDKDPTLEAALNAIAEAKNECAGSCGIFEGGIQTRVDELVLFPESAAKEREHLTGKVAMDGLHQDPASHAVSVVFRETADGNYSRRSSAVQYIAVEFRDRNEKFRYDPPYKLIGHWQPGISISRLTPDQVRRRR